MSDSLKFESIFFSIEASENIKSSSSQNDTSKIFSQTYETKIVDKKYLILNDFFIKIQEILLPKKTKKYDLFADDLQENIVNDIISNLLSEIKKLKEKNEQNKKDKLKYDSNHKNEKINEKSLMEKESKLIDQFKTGGIIYCPGKGETFSFIIPVTEINDPLLIKIFDLPKSSEDTNYFDNILFLKNIYFDKNKLLKYFGIEDIYQKKNYIFYTDEALNRILEKIIVTNDKSIIFSDKKLYSIYINC